MTPAARVAAAIDLLDTILAGSAAEKALTTWARKNRFAGSGDRAALRDLVFDALRCRRSFGALGNGSDGRALMIGALRAQGQDVETVFSGAGYAPQGLSEIERAQLSQAVTMPEAVALDCPDWLEAPLRASLGADFERVMAALQHRAPVFVRVNLARSDRATVQAALGAEGIETRTVDLVSSALEATKNARKIQNSAAYKQGLIELQDAASQAVVAMLPLASGRVLDYCAGGGGKTLAMAALGPAEYFAHDANPGRMRDLPVRAARAGAKITVLAPGAAATAGKFDLVLLDVPCSGSGSWRRAPQSKWDLTAERLRELTSIQTSILQETKDFVSDGGVLAYVTCSMFDTENGDQVAAFLARNSDWEMRHVRRLTPLDGGDGFFIALLTRIQNSFQTT